MGREDELNYEKCAHCWHFVQPNYETQIPGYAHLALAEYVHLDDGEKEHDHDAAPSGDVRTLGTWKRDQPALFHRHADGSIGPNSSLFKAEGEKLMRCPVCGYQLPLHKDGTLPRHKRFADGGGPRTGQSHKMVNCEGGGKKP